MSPSHRFHPAHVEHTGGLTLPFSLRHVFPLFSPEGERAWVPGWDPDYLHPDHPSTAPGTVFRTTHNGEDTLWLILEYDPASASAAYGRFSPGSRLGTIHVSCFEEGPHRTRVSITYSLTAIAAAGNSVLANFTAEAYATMLENWQAAIVSSQHGLSAS